WVGAWRSYFLWLPLGFGAGSELPPPWERGRSGQGRQDLQTRAAGQRTRKLEIFEPRSVRPTALESSSKPSSPQACHAWTRSSGAEGRKRSLPFVPESTPPAWAWRLAPPTAIRRNRTDLRSSSRTSVWNWTGIRSPPPQKAGLGQPGLVRPLDPELVCP